MTLHRVAPIWISPYVMGSLIEIVDARIARASLEVPSVLFEPGTDLYGCMSDITL